MLIGFMISKSLIDVGTAFACGWLNAASLGDTGGLPGSICEEAADDCRRCRYACTTGDECSVPESCGEVVGDGKLSSAMERRGFVLIKGDEGPGCRPGDG